MTLRIDCDSHIMEPPDLWLKYLEPEFRDRAIRIEQAEGGEKLIIGETTVMEGRLAGLGGAHLDRMELFNGSLKYTDGCPLPSYDAQARGELLDEWGMDACVVFPTIGILPFPTEDQALRNAYNRAYNNWQVDYSAALPGRILPIACVNWEDRDGAAEELKRCIDLGFKGLFVPPETVHDKKPSDPWFDPLWRLCEDAGIPGCLHVIVRFSGAAIPFASWHQTGTGPVFSFGMGAPGQIMPALAAIVTDGLFDRFPTLKIVSVEAGCGWAAYLMDRLDEKHQFFGPMTSLQRKPSDYIRDNCYFVAEPEERTIGSMLELVGQDKILWGSDYPHVDSTLEAPRLIRESIAGLTPAQQEAVLGGNAVKLFGL